MTASPRRYPGRRSPRSSAPCYGRDRSRPASPPGSKGNRAGDRGVLRANIVELQLRRAGRHQRWAEKPHDGAVSDGGLSGRLGNAVLIQQVAPDADGGRHALAVLRPATLCIELQRARQGRVGKQGLADALAGRGIVEHELRDTGQGLELRMHAFQQKVGALRRRVDIGAQEFLVGVGQARADLRRHVLRQALHVEDRDAARQEQGEKQGDAHHEDELGAETAQRETAGRGPGAADIGHCHSGLVPEATQIGQPA